MRRHEHDQEIRALVKQLGRLRAELAAARRDIDEHREEQLARRAAEVAAGTRDRIGQVIPDTRRVKRLTESYDRVRAALNRLCPDQRQLRSYLPTHW